MAINKKLKGIYMGFFDGIETFVANRIAIFQARQELRHYCPSIHEKEYEEVKKQVNEYWKKWRKINPRWAWYNAKMNGIFDPRYIPNDLYYTKIDQYFNNRKLAWGFCDKNYYSILFAGIKQPETIARNIGGVLEDDNYELVSIDKILEKIKGEDEVICKPSLESGSGRNIQFWKFDNDEEIIRTFLNDKQEKDYIIQKIIKQHPVLDKIHKDSINSIRVVSLLMQDGVHILSSNFRMGVGDGRLDNVHAGGIGVGVNEDGTLKEYAMDILKGVQVRIHPQGLVFKGFQLPEYGKVIDLVKRAAPLIPHFRLVSWDIAVDSEGEAMLIEANLRKGGIELIQFNNGPLFGDLTDAVLDEVFINKKRI